MEALSSASARGSGGVLRTFSGASASRLSGISRMSGSALGAMKFMRISLEGCLRVARDPPGPGFAHPPTGCSPALGGAWRERRCGRGEPAAGRGDRWVAAIRLDGAGVEAVWGSDWPRTVLDARLRDGGALPTALRADRRLGKAEDGWP